MPNAVDGRSHRLTDRPFAQLQSFDGLTKFVLIIGKTDFDALPELWLPCYPAADVVQEPLADCCLRPFVVSKTTPNVIAGRSWLSRWAGSRRLRRWFGWTGWPWFRRLVRAGWGRAGTASGI